MLFHDRDLSVEGLGILRTDRESNEVIEPCREVRREPMSDLEKDIWSDTDSEFAHALCFFFLVLGLRVCYNVNSMLKNLKMHRFCLQLTCS